MPIMRGIQHALEAAFNRVTGRQAEQEPQQETHAEDSEAIVLGTLLTIGRIDKSRLTSSSVSDRPTPGVDDGPSGPALVARLHRAQTAALKARRERAALQKRELELCLETLWLNGSYEAKKRMYEAKKLAYESDLKETERLEKQIEMLKAWSEGRIDDQTFKQYLVTYKTRG